MVTKPSRVEQTKIYFDGGCRPNPGTMEIAVVIRGAALRAGAGAGTSETAEWLALIAAAAAARERGIPRPLFLGDALGVVRQANGAACRSAHVRALRTQFADGCAAFEHVRVRHVRRNQNLAGIALAAAFDR